MASEDDSSAAAVDQAQQDALPAQPSTPKAWPPPPAYYRLYGPAATSGVRIERLPPPRLHFGRLRVFGQECQFDEADEVIDFERNCLRLYPGDAFQTDATKQQLVQLNRSLLVSFLQLLDLLIQQPSRFQEKIYDIETIFLNMNFLLNSYRPYQARLTLASLLAAQLARRDQAIDGLKQALLETKALLQSLADELPSLVDVQSHEQPPVFLADDDEQHQQAEEEQAVVDDNRPSIASDDQQVKQQQLDEQIAALLKELQPATDSKPLVKRQRNAAV